METKKNEKSFEENIEALEEIVKKLENGDVPLDDAITQFKEGMKLADECKKRLDNAEGIITKVLNSNGELEDFDTSSIEE